ncbi:MAG: cytidine deaminase [Faecalimonas sp.]|nr:cytidine deaminase [Faecalimonas sp.]
MTKEQLMSKAKEAMQKAYSPYSGYKVGAALLCKGGAIYTGCNIENASYSATNCAERTAIFKAISEGEKEFEAIAICGGKEGVISGAFPPCGVCRQVMREFCDDTFLVHIATADGMESYTLKDLLPMSFAPEHMATPEDL